MAVSAKMVTTVYKQGLQYKIPANDSSKVGLTSNGSSLKGKNKTL